MATYDAVWNLFALLVAGVFVVMFVAICVLVTDLDRAKRKIRRLQAGEQR